MVESTPRSDPSTPARRRGSTPLRLLGAAVALGAFALFGGPTGLAVGVAVAIGCVLLPGPFAFALGHLGLLGAFPDPAPAEVVPVEAGLLLSLTAATAAAEGARAVVAVAAAFVGLTAVVVTGVVATDAPWLVAGLLGAVVAALAYGVHRYERLRLGLTDERA